jgi:hypothetical protein
MVWSQILYLRLADAGTGWFGPLGQTLGRLWGHLGCLGPLGLSGNGNGQLGKSGYTPL